MYQKKKGWPVVISQYDSAWKNVTQHVTKVDIVAMMTSVATVTMVIFFTFTRTKLAINLSQAENPAKDKWSVENRRENATKE